MKRASLHPIVAAGLLACAAPSWAAVATSGTLYYTTFSGGANVNRVDYSYDGGALDSSFTLSNITNISSTPGADGIAFDPNNGHLLVGGQGTAVYRVNPVGGAVTSASTSPVAAFHLEVDPSNAFVYASGIPGGLSRVPIGGAFGAAGTAFTIAPSGGTITQLIFTPTGTNYYTSSGPAGTGTFGEIVLSGTTATLTPLFVTAAAHGGEYDPFTGDIILFGDGAVTQITGIGGIESILATLSLPSLANLDQGTADGAGHIFGASNGGSLLFIDYSASGVLTGAGTFVDADFLASSLDDIAPLVGPGSNIPEPTSILVWTLLGLAGVGYSVRRRWRQ